MSLINLSGYHGVQTNLFVRIDIPGYPSLTFSDYHKSYTITDTSYTDTIYVGLGQLLSVSNVTNNLRSAPQQLVISISGIPSANIPEVVGTKIKGSNVTVYRAFFDPTTGNLLPITGNPANKFIGVVNNYSIDDNLTMGAYTGDLSLTLTITSIVEVLNNKVAGRRTNPTDEKNLFPQDKSFDRVPSLSRSNFQFGAPHA